MNAWPTVVHKTVRLSFLSSLLPFIFLPLPSSFFFSFSFIFYGNCILSTVKKKKNPVFFLLCHCIYLWQELFFFQMLLVICFRFGLETGGRMTEISIFLWPEPEYSSSRGGLWDLFYKRDLQANYISFSIFYLVPTLVVQSSLYFLTSSHVPNIEKVRYTEKNILEKHGWWQSGWSLLFGEFEGTG